MYTYLLVTFSKCSFLKCDGATISDMKSPFTHKVSHNPLHPCHNACNCFSLFDYYSFFSFLFFFFFQNLKHMNLAVVLVDGELHRTTMLLSINRFSIAKHGICDVLMWCGPFPIPRDSYKWLQGQPQCTTLGLSLSAESQPVLFSTMFLCGTIKARWIIGLGHTHTLTEPIANTFWV